MVMEMRELKGDDLFALLSIVGKLDIKEEFTQMFETNVDEAGSKVVPMDKQKKEPTKAQKAKLDQIEAQKAKEAEKRGVKAAAGMMQKTLMNIKVIKVEINELLADLTDSTVEEIRDLKLNDYTGLIVQFFKKEELKDFFSHIASLV